MDASFNNIQRTLYILRKSLFIVWIPSICRWSVLNMQAGKCYCKNFNPDIESVSSATFIHHFSLRFLWRSWLWQPCKNLCLRCAQTCYLNIVSFLTDFNGRWNVPLNFGTPPQYNLTPGLECFHVQEQTGGVFLDRWPTKLHIHL
jgi:hypothetical protein